MILVIIIVNKDKTACNYKFSPRNVTHNHHLGRRDSTNDFFLARTHSVTRDKPQQMSIIQFQYEI